MAEIIEITEQADNIQIYPRSLSDLSDDVNENVNEVFSDDDIERNIAFNTIPSLGARRNQPVVRPHFTLSPYNRRYRLFKILLALVATYSAFIGPYEFGFGFHHVPAPLTALDFAADMYFAMDIILTFFVAYRDKKTYTLIYTYKRIAWNYKYALVLDIVSTFPAPCVRWISLNAYGILSMFRIWRFRRLCRLFSRFEKNRRLNYSFVRCARMFCIVLFTIHLAGCSHHGLAIRYPDSKTKLIQDTNQGKWNQYVTGLYWAMTTLSTVGYGDIHAVNTLEKIFVVFLMMSFMGVSAYVLGNMGYLASLAARNTQLYIKATEEVSLFAQRNGLTGPLEDRIQSCVLLNSRMGSEGLQDQEIVDSLPHGLRSTIYHKLFHEQVRKIYLLRRVPNHVILQLVSKCKPYYFPRGEYVICESDAPTYFYMIVTGQADLIAVTTNANGQTKEELLKVAKAGELCGEIGVLCRRPQPFTVRTTRLSQLVRFKSTHFFDIVNANDDALRAIGHNLRKHCGRITDRRMRDILGDIEIMFRQGPPNM